MDVTPEQTETAWQWHVFKGVNGMWYAQRLFASPPVTFRRHDLAELHEVMSDWENEHDPPSLHPGPGVFPRPPWAKPPDRGEEASDACDAAAPRDPPDRRVLPLVTATAPGEVLRVSPGAPAPT